MMSQLLEEFKLTLEPLTDNGETRHHMTMTFIEDGIHTNYQDSYTLDELEEIELSLINILQTIYSYRYKESRNEIDTN